MNFKKEDFFIRYKGIFFFIFFWSLQITSSKLLFYFTKKDEVYGLVLSFLFFFLIFCILEAKYPTYINFFDHNENWFITMGSSLKTSFIAFGLGYLITLAFISIILVIEKLLLPIMGKSPILLENIIKYLDMPNRALADVIAILNRNGDSLTVILWFLSIVVLAPISEEILFRGFLQDFFSNLIKNKKVVIGLTAIIFSLFHLPSLSNTLFTFIVGIFLSIEKEKSGKINIPIWIHAIINFTGILTTIIFQQVLIKSSM